MKDLYFNVVNGFPVNSSISDSLKKNWNNVKSFLTRLRDKGIKAKDQVIQTLKDTFKWMSPDDAEEAFYQYYFVAASVHRVVSGVLSGVVDEYLERYPFVSVRDNRLILDKQLPDGNHAYFEYDLVRDEVLEAVGNYFGDIGPGPITKSKLDELLVRLDSIDSSTRKICSRRGGEDAPRMEFFNFLQTIPSVTTSPKTKNDISKDDYSGSADKDEYAAYYYTFRAPDGVNYSIEYLVDLKDNTGELWVEDETLGKSLGHFPVDDTLDLGDYEANLVEDMLSTAIGEGPKNSRATDKNFASVEQLKDFYKKSKISKDDAISSLIDQFEYSSDSAQTEVESWGKNYYEQTHKVSASLKRQTRYRKFISSRRSLVVSDLEYYGHTIPDGEPNAGSYAVTDKDGNVLGIFPNKDAAEAAGYTN